MAEESSEASTTELCCSCNDLVLDPIGDLGHREIPFANFKQTAQAGCSTCDMLLRGILTQEQEIQDVKKVVLWSFGKTEPLNVNLWTEGGLKQEFEFYWAPECEDQKKSFVDHSPKASPAWPVIGRARHISPDSSTENCFKQAQDWLFNCCFKHNCCGGYEHLPLPTRVLELLSDEYATLCEPKSYEKDHYAALSHCWGYLWIDSLCIIQDSEEDWQVEAGKMSAVYRNATFTIAAHGSGDSNGGCFVSGASRQHRYSTIRGTNKDGVESDVHIRLSGFREPNRDEGLAHIARGNKDKPLPSRLSTRGWVFQERLLSQRTLHYTGSELVFECRAGLQCECKVGMDTSVHATNFKRQFIEEAADTKTGFRSPNLLPRWLELVEHYTKLQLTKQSDRLPALSGLAGTNWEEIYWESKTDTPAYIFGLWKKTFHRDLHWRSAVEWSSGTASTHSRHEEGYAPSWSWASVTGPIEYEQQVKGNDLEQNRFFKILEIIVEPSTKNKFGPGSGSFVAVCVMVPSKVILVDHRGEPAYIIAGTKALEGGTACPYDTFHPDITDGHPEVSDRQDCFFMITSTIGENPHRHTPMGLVLVKCDDSYKRVGYLRSTKYTTNEWQEGSELMTVRVV
ncbi:hypothetical protein BDZ45DRAFT_731673 [Acephala macrosclerotiorum]|nr:hypothetical protein BDZ45DRAFT_731673 [Acephala macrosclerotiorum]